MSVVSAPVSAMPISSAPGYAAPIPSWPASVPPTLPYDDFEDDDSDVAGAFLTAAFLSGLIHAGIVITMLTIFFDRPVEQPPLEIITDIAQEELAEEEIPIQIFRFSKEELPDIGSASVAGIDVPAPSADRVEELTKLRTETNPVEIAKYEAPVALDVSQATNFSYDVKIKGAAGVGAVGAVGAVDRITQEILLTLEQGPTLVVWFFDRSWSMYPMRQDINNRFDRIYKELGVSHLVAKRKDQPVLTSVISFGENVQVMTPELTDNLDEIKAAVSAIENDASGIEMTFNALGMAAEKYRVHHQQGLKRNIMFVLFTDEVGDDEEKLEPVIQLCRNNAIRVYVVGTPAPFGRKNIEFKYVDPDPNYDQRVQWLPVRAGPETVMPEQLQLGFTGLTERDSAVYRLDSGFGPFALTRLCYETGGIFFAVHPARPEDAEGFVPRNATPPMSPAINYFFDSAVMRPYAPNYVPTTEYKELVMSNRARQALIAAAERSMLMPMTEPPMSFDRNPENEALLKRALDEAQKKAAIIEPQINELYQVMKQGEVDRPKLSEPRWQAGFDLAMGRLLALKVRTEGYNAILAKAKFGLKLDNPKSNILELKQADEVTTGSQHQKMAAQSKELLESVIRDHSGTPWAYLAEEELKQPLGWKWTERFDPPPPPAPTVRPTPTVNNGGNRPPVRRPLPQNANPKPIRQNVKL